MEKNKNSQFSKYNAFLAQLVEYLHGKQKVAGSSPVKGYFFLKSKQCQKLCYSSQHSNTLFVGKTISSGLNFESYFLATN